MKTVIWSGKLVNRNLNPKIEPTEDEEQEALFILANQMRILKYPELRLLYAIPNGGYRHPATAARLARTGVKAGVPDVCLPVSRGKWHGLYIELKRRKKGVVSVYQKEWIIALTEQGYKAAVCKGCEEAIEVIEEYLGEA